MSPQDGLYQKLRNCVHILLNLCRENCGLFFPGHGVRRENNARGVGLYRVVQKTAPLSYFCDNFRKWTPILTLFSPLEQEIYGA